MNEICELPLGAMNVDVRAELIQALIPIGLWHVKEVLEQEVKQLAGERYKREGLLERGLRIEEGLLCVVDGSRKLLQGNLSTIRDFLTPLG